MPEALLNAIRRFVPLSPGDEEMIGRQFRQLVLEKNEYWLREGDLCRQWGFVEKGLLRFYMNDKGRDITHYFSAENDFVCNYESYLGQRPSRKYIQAITPCSLWVIPLQELNPLFRNLSHGERLGRLLMEKELLLTTNRFLEHYTFSPEQRYRYFLEHYPQLANRIPQYHIAAYVGVQPQSLSRIRRRMAKA